MRIVNRLLILSGLLTLASCATQETRPPDVLIQEFRGDTPEAWRGDAQLADAYGKVLDSLMPGLSATKELDRQEAEQTVEDLCVRGGRPGAERHRAALCRALAARIGPQTAPSARLWLLRQLARLGRGECVDALAARLTDEDPKVRDAAKRALQHNPDADAGQALLSELSRSGGLAPRQAGAASGPADASWTVALINAVAARREKRAEAVLTELALRGDAPLSTTQPPGAGRSTSESIVADEPVACAAVAALGELGAVDAVEQIARKKASASQSPLFGRLVEARLRCAEHLLAGRKRNQAAELYRKVMAAWQRPDVRVAALAGLCRAEGAQALPNLLEQMSDADAQVRIAAAAEACRLDGEAVTRRLVDPLSSLPIDVQVRLMDGLAARGDATAKLAVLGGLQDPSAEVRAAAARAMGRIGGAAHVRLLARLAAERTGQEQKAARESLAALRDPAFDKAALYALESSPAPIQAEVCRALKVRGSSLGVPWVLGHLSELEPAAQIAALEYMGALASGADLRYAGGVLPTLMHDEAVLAAAEDAIVAIASRQSEGSRSSEMLMELENQDDAHRPPLIRILGRIGEPEGLNAIREYQSAQDAAVKDAAVRALCDWKDATALSDVWDLMKTSTDAAHRSLAFRAYVRLLKLPEAGRTPQQTLAMYDDALTVAQSADEKKLLLSGMSDLTCAEALDRLEAALSDPALQAEAAVAMCSVARGICGADPQRARAAVERVRGYAASDAVQKAAEEAIQHLDRYQGYITSWKFCGPFSVAGKDAGALFDIPAGPEPGADAAAAPSPATVEWRDLPVTDARSPWLFDLNQAASGANCCVYVKTTLTCPAQTPAKLEIGSDDCVKVWLNGQLVHANKAFRPLAAASDSAPVTLSAGANELLLKVVQGSGGWGVCCGVKTADGGNIAGLTIASP